MSDRRPYEGSAKQAWTWGIVGFGAVMLLSIGVVQLIQGFSAIAEDEVFVVGAEYAFAFDLTTWGWIQVVLGVLALAVGAGLLGSRNWARIGAVIIASIGSVAQFAFMPYYPLWSIVLIAFNVAVIWAVSTQSDHGE
ncbi:MULTISPECIES: hypothetical protein [unclassified Aeromicrobium]|uniref:DUF7144 family membrane protein n=1 Tax=unclassified Aeromicrobium TaxID=2633570 RepID=UPI00396AF7A1